MLYDLFFDKYRGKKVRLKLIYKGYYDNDVWYISGRCCSKHTCNKVYVDKHHPDSESAIDEKISLICLDVFYTEFTDEINSVALEKVLNLIKTKMAKTNDV